MTLYVAIGQPVTLTACCHDGIQVALESEHIVEAARKHPLTQATLEEQFARLGGSVYKLNSLQATIEDQPMVPLSVLGTMRKQLIEALDTARTQVQPRECRPAPLVTSLLDSILELDDDSEAGGNEAAQPRLIVLCRSLPQLEQVLACGIRDCIADFHDLRQYADAAKLARDHQASLLVSTLRIHKPGEDVCFAC